MDRARENIKVKTPKTKQVSSNTKDNYCCIFLLFSLIPYNAMTRAFGDSRLLFPKSKCNVTDNRVILNVRTNKFENSHTIKTKLIFDSNSFKPLPFTRPCFNYVGFVYDDGDDTDPSQRLIFIQGRSESLFCIFLGGQEYHLLTYFLF